MSTIAKTKRQRSQKMGHFSVEVQLANLHDLYSEQDGTISADQVRRVTLSGIVDCGATRLVLPASTVKQLGLSITGEIKVKYADGRKAKRKVASNVDLEFNGRRGTFSAIVEPKRTDALIGAIVLEELDLVPDGIIQMLLQRDPNGLLAEIE